MNLTRAVTQKSLENTSISSKSSLSRDGHCCLNLCSIQCFRLLIASRVLFMETGIRGSFLDFGGDSVRPSSNFPASIIPFLYPPQMSRRGKKGTGGARVPSGVSAYPSFRVLYASHG